MDSPTAAVLSETTTTINTTDIPKKKKKTQRHVQVVPKRHLELTMVVVDHRRILCQCLAGQYRLHDQFLRITVGTVGGSRKFFCGQQTGQSRRTRLVGLASGICSTMSDRTMVGRDLVPCLFGADAHVATGWIQAVDLFVGHSLFLAPCLGSCLFATVRFGMDLGDPVRPEPQFVDDHCDPLHVEFQNLFGQLVGCVTAVEQKVMERMKESLQLALLGR